MNIVICAHSIGAPIMGGDAARLDLLRQFTAIGAGVETCTYDTLSTCTGRDAYFLESPVKSESVALADGKVTFILRHGDCQMAFLAHDVLDTPGVYLMTPTEWAYQQIGWRIEQRVVQWMALNPDPLNAPIRPGKKVLHVRAFDFQKDTPLAVRVAQELPDVEFVFRVQAGARRFIIPCSNVTCMPATTSPEELWADIGCLLVTSKYETFCMTAYEAVARGIPVVRHSSLWAIDEWDDGYAAGADTVANLAQDVRRYLRYDDPALVDWSAALRGHAQRVHDTALEQFRCIVKTIEKHL